MRLIAGDLCVARGERIVIGGLSFEARGGEVLLVTGPNGAGKTTLLRALAGLLPPLSGAIRLDGGDPERTVGEQCHFIGHANGLKASFTVAENLAFWAAYLGGAEAWGERPFDDAADPSPLPEERDGRRGHFQAASQARKAGPALGQRIARALGCFALGPLADIPARYLSAGQKRRAGLARLVAAHRPVWLLDEPTAALDSASAALVVDAIDAHTAGGGAVIAATHLELGVARSRELALG